MRLGSNIYALCASVYVVVILVLSIPGVEGQQAVATPFKLKKNGAPSLKDILRLVSQAPVADRITDAELEKIKAASPILYDERFRKTEEAKMPPRGDLYRNSTILGVAQFHTIVPDHAIVHMPEGMEHYVIDDPQGPLLFWNDFLGKNLGWLTTQEISLDQASGKEKLPTLVEEQIRQSELIVVATHKGFPISMLPTVEELTTSQ